MDWSCPTPANQAALAGVHARLRAAGVPEGPHGYDLVALELAAALLGWASDAGPAAPGAPVPSVAAVWRHSRVAAQRADRPSPPRLGLGRGRGPGPGARPDAR
jgi:hypothetical protein